MAAQTKQLNFEKRKQKSLQRLGSENPHCSICGEADWRCLELHHIGQEGFDALTGIVCRNCHRKVSDAQQDHPQPLTKTEPIILERIGHLLFGLADFLELLIDRLRESGHQLIELARQFLDSNPSTPLLAREG